MREKIYTAIKDYIELALNDISTDLDNNLRIELATDELGGEWTGVKLSKMPTGKFLKAFIDGSKILAFRLQVLSAQEKIESNEHMIDYSSYLEKLGDKLLSMQKQRILPDFPEGVKLERIETTGASTLNYANEKYAGYVFDVTFNLKMRGI